MPLPTWQVFNVHTAKVAQSVLVVGGVVSNDAIIFAGEIIKPAVDRRHSRQVIQHLLNLFNEFLQVFRQRGAKWLLALFSQQVRTSSLCTKRFGHSGCFVAFCCFIQVWLQFFTINLSNFASMIAIILLLPQLLPRQQNRKDVVSSKACLLLDLIGCFGQK